MHGERKGEHRRTPVYGSGEQRYTATTYRKGNNIHRKSVRQGKKKILSRQERKDRHSQKPERSNHHLDERYTLQDFLQGTMEQTTKSTGA